MKTYLSKEQIKNFIEKYGDGDVYVSHYTRTDGLVEIKYLPKIRKFVEDESIKHLITEEFKEHPHLKDKYIQVIIISDKFAHIPASATSNKNPLVKNYQKFLDDVKKENQMQK